MSDRKLREAAGKLIDAVDPHIVPWVFIDELSALRRVVRENEDPDVVKVLRAIEKLESAPGCSCPLTLAYLRENVEKTFHIRLIDKEPGYEWMEEEDNAEDSEG